MEKIGHLPIVVGALPPSNGTFPDIFLPFFLLHFNPRTLHLVKIENIIVKSFGSNWTLLGCSDR